MSKQLSLAGCDQPASWTTSVMENLEREFHSFDCGGGGLAGREVIFLRGRGELAPSFGWGETGVRVELKGIPEQALTRPIAALDSTCIPVAELQDGSLYASRAGVVLVDGSSERRYARFGPFLHYLTDATQPRIPGRPALGKEMALDSSLAEHAIRIQLERSIAAKLLPMISGSLLLLDGCLRASLFERAETCLSRILDEAHEHKITVVGISKTTKVRILASLSGVLLEANLEGVYCDVHSLVQQFLHGLLGRVFLARFTRNGMVFRVDVARESAEEAGLIFSGIRASDSLYNGYPDSLRLAHHLSVFAGSEVSAVKAFVASKLGARPLSSQDPRLILLGHGLVRGRFPP